MPGNLLQNIFVLWYSVQFSLILQHSTKHRKVFFFSIYLANSEVWWEHLGRNSWNSLSYVHGPNVTVIFSPSFVAKRWMQLKFWKAFVEVGGFQDPSGQSPELGVGGWTGWPSPAPPARRVCEELRTQARVFVPSYVSFIITAMK